MLAKYNTTEQESAPLNKIQGIEDFLQFAQVVTKTTKVVISGVFFFF